MEAARILDGSDDVVAFSLEAAEEEVGRSGRTVDVRVGLLVLLLAVENREKRKAILGGSDGVVDN